jgi:hypothetical protein
MHIEINVIRTYNIQISTCDYISNTYIDMKQKNLPRYHKIVS